MRVAPIVATLALLAAGCSKEAPKEDAPRPVVVRKVELGQTEQLNVYSGEVRARHEADLGFRVGGKVVARRVNLGDSVHRGQVLASLDPKDIALSATAARAQVASAEADLKLASVEYERAQSLAARQFVSGSVVDQRRASLLAAQARLNQAKAQADVAGNQTDYATLTADHDGVITAVSAEPGQVVAAGQAVFRLAEEGEREVLIYIPEKRVAGIKEGSPVLVRPWANPNSVLEGKVREIGAAADVTTRTFPVRVSVKQGDKLPLGATAAVAFPGDRNGSVVLPHGAVVQRDGATGVWLVGPDGKLEWRKVQVARYSEAGTLLSSGLSGNEQVVVIGAHKLVPGMKVRPIPQTAPVALDVKR